jgi:hypothetical protein
MDPAVRSALARDVEEQVGEHGEVNVQQELATIEGEIEKAKQLLQQSEAKETFLGQRSAQYRKALDERARLLRQEQDELHARKEKLLQEVKAAATDDDEEEGNNEINTLDIDLAKRLEAWEKDEDALTSIVETHKQILAHCEEIRRKIKELERKRAECVAMAGECRDFLDTVAAAAAETNAAAQESTSASSSSLPLEENANNVEMASQSRDDASNNVRQGHDREQNMMETAGDEEELSWRALDSASAV